MATVYTPVEFLHSAFNKGDIRPSVDSHRIRVVGFHLYNENAVIVNLLRKLFVKTKIMGAKPILMLVLDESTYVQSGRCHVWTAQSQDGETFRIVYVDDAYDVFFVEDNKANKGPRHLGTARSVYFPKPSPSFRRRSLKLSSSREDANDLISHVLNSARSFYSSASSE